MGSTPAGHSVIAPDDEGLQTRGMAPHLPRSRPFRFDSGIPLSTGDRLTASVTCAIANQGAWLRGGRSAWRFDSSPTDCGVDWRWYQPGLISPLTRVRVPPPRLETLTASTIRYSRFDSCKRLRAFEASRPVVWCNRSARSPVKAVEPGSSPAITAVFRRTGVPPVLLSEQAGRLFYDWSAGV